MSEFQPAPLPDTRVEVGGATYLPDATGRLIPVDAIKPQHMLEHEVTRKVMGFAVALSDQVTRFKGHAFEDLGAFDALLDQEYGVTPRGRKGNRTYQSHDGLMKVELRVADQLDFGPELQAAKALLDECMNEWAADARPEVRTLITGAFNTDKEGQVNRSEIFMLLRLEFDDPRWQRAMEAIRAAIRVVGSKQYLRFLMRPSVTAPWQTVTIDLAAA